VNGIRTGIGIDTTITTGTAITTDMAA
jgi:hypothetical protein